MLRCVLHKLRSPPHWAVARTFSFGQGVSLSSCGWSGRGSAMTICSAARTPSHLPRRQLSSTSEQVDATSIVKEPPHDVKASSARPSTPSLDHAEKHTFQAETRQILDIVAKSLYTDREVFLRELISNASDALEKLRHNRLSGEDAKIDADKPLEIHVDVYKDKNLITVQDSGVGMTHDELVSHLGTIARSGSKAFVKAVKEGGSKVDNNIIGQFGVGFYSTFMVADKVEVFTHSSTGKDVSRYWSSDGSGEYVICEADNVERGTKVVVALKEDAVEFADVKKIEGIIKKYSNFVNFPIFLNGSKVNTVEAIWSKQPSDVDEKKHSEFYKYLAAAWDNPRYTLHFHTDVPISIQALFYFPLSHTEKFGMGRMEAGVSLYSRKVLIQGKTNPLLPEWMRFVKGVVDSEDIPLNISRENMQDNALVLRIKNVLIKRIIRFLDEQSSKDPDTYKKFFAEHGLFIKEGICTDLSNKDAVAKLFRCESSTSEAGELVSFDDYISRMYPGQKGIYYLLAPDRSYAVSSPYFEAFREKGTEVLFLYQDIDDFVMKNLDTYSDKKLISIESADAGSEQPAPSKVKTDGKKSTRADVNPLTSSETSHLIDFLTATLGGRVQSVKPTDRLRDTPAIVVDHESAAVRKMIKYVDQRLAHSLPKQKLEINPSHPLIVGLAKTIDSDKALATLVAEQIYDNALIAADILDNPRSMVRRLNELLGRIVDK